jgi:hypothetical protein
MTEKGSMAEKARLAGKAGLAGKGQDLAEKAGLAEKRHVIWHPGQILRVRRHGAGSFRRTGKVRRHGAGSFRRTGKGPEAWRKANPAHREPLFPYYDYEHGKFTAKASNILRCFGPISV